MVHPVAGTGKTLSSLPELHAVKATDKSRQWQKRNPRAWITFRDLQLVIEHHNNPDMGNR
ncbi:hypothetical protein MTE1_5298 [Klebsiella pneumoniae JHCK1]|nr:hypothetical protein MTE1_5298 [Klebsiella pneumoniae JHCK1]